MAVVAGTPVTDDTRPPSSREEVAKLVRLTYSGRRLSRSLLLMFAIPTLVDVLRKHSLQYVGQDVISNSWFNNPVLTSILMIYALVQGLLADKTTARHIKQLRKTVHSQAFMEPLLKAECGHVPMMGQDSLQNLARYVIWYKYLQRLALWSVGALSCITVQSAGSSMPAMRLLLLMCPSCGFHYSNSERYMSVCPGYEKDYEEIVHRYYIHCQSAVLVCIAIASHETMRVFLDYVMIRVVEQVDSDALQKGFCPTLKCLLTSRQWLSSVLQGLGPRFACKLIGALLAATMVCLNEVYVLDKFKDCDERGSVLEEHFFLVLLIAEFILDSLISATAESCTKKKSRTEK